MKLSVMRAMPSAPLPAIPARLLLTTALLPLFLGLSAGISPAQTQNAPVKPPKPAPVKPAPVAPAPVIAAPAAPAAATDAATAFATGKAAFEALPESDRRAVQEALIWTGDFQGSATGEFGKRTHDALRSFETRTHNNADGTVDVKEVAQILAAAQVIKKSVGFAVVTDPVSGIQIGVPQKLFPAKSATPEGSVFASADGSHKLALFFMRGAETDLAKQYETASASTPDRKVTYKLLKPDYFVVSGEEGGSKFYSRFALVTAGSDKLVRGFLLFYPMAGAKEFNSTALAIANSFGPMPGAVPPVAGKDVPPPPVRPQPAGGGGVATATVIASGKAVAILPPGCTTPAAGTLTFRVAGNDPETGLTLLEFAAPKTRPVTFGATGLADDAALIVAGFGEGPVPASAPGLSATPGQAVVRDDAKDRPRILAAVQPPAAGSAVFDRSGHFVGVIGASSKAPRRFAGVVPQMTHALLGQQRILQFAGVTGAAPPAGSGDEKPRSLGEIVAMARESLIGVECRK